MTKPHCSFCGKDMEFVEGDVIFGENWYHQNCSKQVAMLETQIHEKK